MKRGVGIVVVALVLTFSGAGDGAGDRKRCPYKHKWMCQYQERQSHVPTLPSSWHPTNRRWVVAREPQDERSNVRRPWIALIGYAGVDRGDVPRRAPGAVGSSADGPGRVEQA